MDVATFGPEQRDVELRRSLGVHDNDFLFVHVGRLAIDPALHGRLAGNGRRTAEGLTWESELDRLDVSYREVIADSALQRFGNRGGSGYNHAQVTVL